MATKKFRYVAQRYRQGSSELELYAFCASAKDIRSWGGVPAKTEQFHGGFQRALSSRYKKIAKYFEDGLASPTSIVVAFREGALKKTDLGFPGDWPKRDELSNSAEFSLISFEFESYDDTTDLKTLIARVNELLEPRLKASATADDAVDDSNGDDNSAEEGDGADAGAEEDNLEATDSEEEEVLDVGHSKLRGFHEFINDEGKLTAWLRTETDRHKAIEAKATKTAREAELIQYSPEQRLKAALLSLLRPAMIVDGQHRVNGAYESPSEIQFTVCAIRDADWVEQVFQFVILNKLAKPISGDFLTALLNTSLTNKEVNEIEERLDTVGIKNEDRILMKYLNFDERSPFYQMIADAGEVAGTDNKGKLSARGMLRLAKRWIAIRKDRKELQMFWPIMGVSSRAKARAAWKSGPDNMEYPITLFYAFWQAMKEHYGPHKVWEKEDKFHLLYIVTMHVLQDLFLSTKATADVTYQDVESFKIDVKRFFADVTPAFFVEWSATGLQSGDGPKNIREAVEALRDGTRLAKLKETSPLYRS